MQKLNLQQEQISNSMPMKYRVLFEEYLISLLSKKMSKNILPKEEVESLYGGLNEEQRAFVKIVTKKDRGAAQPRLIVFEVKTPE